MAQLLEPTSPPAPAAPRILTRRMQLVEHRFGEPVEVTLVRLYHQEGKSLRQIAAELGVTRALIQDWMRQRSIPRRPPGAPKKRAV